MTVVQDLARDDLGVLLVAVWFVGMACGMAFLAVALAWDRVNVRDAAELHARATSSNRKAGRGAR